MRQCCVNIFKTKKPLVECNNIHVLKNRIVVYLRSACVATKSRTVVPRGSGLFSEEGRKRLFASVPADVRTNVFVFSTLSLSLLFVYRYTMFSLSLSLFADHNTVGARALRSPLTPRPPHTRRGSAGGSSSPKKHGHGERNHGDDDDGDDAASRDGVMNRTC